MDLQSDTSEIQTEEWNYDIIFKVHSFEQLNLPNDLNMKEKQWNKIQKYMKKAHPKYLKQSRLSLQHI